MLALGEQSFPLNLVFRRGLMHALSDTGASVAQGSLVRSCLCACMCVCLCMRVRLCVCGSICSCVSVHPWSSFILFHCLTPLHSAPFYYASLYHLSLSLIATSPHYYILCASLGFCREDIWVSIPAFLAPSQDRSQAL